MVFFAFIMGHLWLRIPLLYQHYRCCRLIGLKREREPFGLRSCGKMYRLGHNHRLGRTFLDAWG